MMKQREAAYDNLKFLLIVLVVMLHCADFYTEKMPVFCSIYIFIYAFVMPAFVFVSGLFSKSALAQSGKTAEKVLYYIILYIFCKMLLTVPSAILSGARFDLLRENGIPWFMLSMAWWYGVTFFVKRFPGKAALGVSILLACLAGYIDSIGDFLCLSKTIVFYPFFLSGYYLEPRELLKKTRGALPRAAGAAAFLALGYVSFFHQEAFYALRPLFHAGKSFAALGSPEFGAVLRLAHYLAAGVLIYGLLALIPRKTFRVSVCGQRTLQVYFFHYIFIYPFRQLSLIEKLPAGAGAAFLFAVCLAVAWVLSLKWFAYPFSWLQKSLQKLLRRNTR